MRGRRLPDGVRAQARPHATLPEQAHHARVASQEGGAAARLTRQVRDTVSLLRLPTTLRCSHARACVGTPESLTAAAYRLSSHAPALGPQRLRHAARPLWRATLKRAGMWLVCGRRCACVAGWGRLFSAWSAVLGRTGGAPCQGRMRVGTGFVYLGFCFVCTCIGSCLRVSCVWFVTCFVGLKVLRSSLLVVFDYSPLSLLCLPLNTASSAPFASCRISARVVSAHVPSLGFVFVRSDQYLYSALPDRYTYSFHMFKKFHATWSLARYRAPPPLVWPCGLQVRGIS